MQKQVPLGVRLNNPGNLEWGSPWEGLVERTQSRYYLDGSPQQKRFCEFVDAAFGIRAIVRTLVTYYDKRKAADGSPIDTVAEVVARWAPSFENDTSAYAAHVAKLMAVDPDQIINIKDYDVMRALVIGIIAHENAGYRYPDAVIDEGLRRGGIVRKPGAKRVPVNVETVAGGAGSAAVGAAQLGPILPHIADAIGSQQDNLTSGDWAKIVIGLVLIGIGAAVAWSQYKKRLAGAV